MDEVINFMDFDKVIKFSTKWAISAYRMSGVDVVWEDGVVADHVEDEMNFAEVGVAADVKVAHAQRVFGRVLVDVIASYQKWA